VQALTDREDETPTIIDLDIVVWRYQCLEEAGYPIELAVLLAERADVDLHTACELVERGATADEALRILT
jgi:hypothetical protein